jgi:hypothetical protein
MARTRTPMQKVHAKRARGNSTENARGTTKNADAQGRVSPRPKTAQNAANTKAKMKNAAAKPKAAKPKNLGARGKTAGAKTVKSAPTIKGNTSTATGRGNLQGKHGDAVKKTAVAKAKRKMRGNLAKTVAKKVGKRVLGVAGAAATVAADRKASVKKARRKAYSQASGKKLDA